jgi:hypothetical protein
MFAFGSRSVDLKRLHGKMTDEYSLKHNDIHDEKFLSHAQRGRIAASTLPSRHLTIGMNLMEHWGRTSWVSCDNRP